MKKQELRTALALLATTEALLKKDQTMKDFMHHFAELICETAGRLVDDGLSEDDKEKQTNKVLSDYGLDYYRTDFI